MPRDLALSIPGRDPSAPPLTAVPTGPSRAGPSPLSHSLGPRHLNGTRAAGFPVALREQARWAGHSGPSG